MVRTRRLVLPLLLVCVACRTSSKDLERWASRQQGPDKLAAVMQHDKFSSELRTEAALTLVGMRPRQGQRIGLERMLLELGRLPANTRSQLSANLVPGLIAKLGRPAPAAAEQNDETIPFKDAAYALWSSSNPRLLSDEGLRSRLQSALIAWLQADFPRRSDDPSQKYGVTQMLREMGPDAVAGLPQLIEQGVKRLPQLCQLIAEVGDTQSKHAASTRLADLARRASNDEELSQLLPALHQIGGVPVRAFLLQLAADPGRSESLRVAALAALEGHVAGPPPAPLAALLDLARTKAVPDAVRELALRRTTELPREQFEAPLFALFDTDDWKLRWLAAEQLLRSGKAELLGRFMEHLEPVRHMALTEPLRYGALIAKLGGTDPGATALLGYTRSPHSPAVRVTALGYFLQQGGSAQLPTLERLGSDTTAVPSCRSEPADCEWSCTVGGEAGPEDRNIETIGQFVRFCVLPAIAGRTAPAPGSNHDAAQESAAPAKDPADP